MSFLDSNDNQSYFLVIEGEQSGPFSGQDIADKLQKGLISTQSLIWWDGQATWHSIESIKDFQSFLSKHSGLSDAPLTTQPPVSSSELSPSSFEMENIPPPDSSPAPEEAIPPIKEDIIFASFAIPGSDLKPVFTKEEGRFDSAPLTVTEIVKKGPIKSRALLMVGIFVALSLISLAFLFLGKPPEAVKPIAKIATKEEVLSERKIKLTKALSEILLQPAPSIIALNDLLTHNPNDEVGVEALRALIDNYRQDHQYQKAGDLLLKVKKPGEAARFFLQEPSLYPQAETSLFLAFQQTQSKESADFLLADIQLLLNSMKNYELATERIRLFEKTFPALNHPYGYYLLPTPQRIQNIFNRLSFYFVETVMKHISTDFPQLKLVTRPLVEVKQTTSGDFRIVAHYQGDVILSNDRIRDIYFVFWLIDDHWNLVDTNLTRERQRYAQVARERYNASVMSPARMLQYLETQFQTQFSDKSLHELPSSINSSPSKENKDF